MLILLVLFVYCYLPGDAPSHMVGNGRIAIVPPCWTNLGKEHSVLWFVTLDCRNEPERAELDFGSKERKELEARIKFGPN